LCLSPFPSLPFRVHRLKCSPVSLPFSRTSCFPAFCSVSLSPCFLSRAQSLFPLRRISSLLGLRFPLPLQLPRRKQFYLFFREDRLTCTLPRGNIDISSLIFAFFFPFLQSLYLPLRCLGYLRSPFFYERIPLCMYLFSSIEKAAFFIKPFRSFSKSSLRTLRRNRPFTPPDKISSSAALSIKSGVLLPLRAASIFSETSPGSLSSPSLRSPPGPKVCLPLL